MNIQKTKDIADINEKIAVVTERVRVASDERNAKIIDQVSNDYMEYFKRAGYKVAREGRTVEATYKGTFFRLKLPQPEDRIIGALLRFDLERENGSKYIISAFQRESHRNAESRQQNNDELDELDKLKGTLADLEAYEAKCVECEIEFKAIRADTKAFLVNHTSLSNIEAALEHIQTL